VRVVFDDEDAVGFAAACGHVFSLTRGSKSRPRSRGAVTVARSATGAGGAGGGGGRFGGFGGGGFGGGAGGGSAVAGTVKLVDGTNVYVTDTNGNVVKVTTNGSSQLTKTDPATTKDVAPGDVVTAVNGYHISSPTSLTSSLLTKKPGDSVTITYSDQSGASNSVKLKLASWPAQ